MPSVPFFKFRFTSSWGMLFLCLSLISGFLVLGFWQIHRAQEKKTMLQKQEDLQKLSPNLWNSNQKMPRNYERIKVRGSYLPQLFLLDNQHHQHQFGYDVLSPLVLRGGDVVFIDRGWVPGGSTGRILPKISIPQEFLELEGYAYFPSKKQWVLGPVFEKKENQTIILERFDEQLVSQLLQKAVYPFIIRLNKKDIYGFIREWEVVSMPPQRHFAYALQWFAMALVLLIIFLALTLKNKNEDSI